MYLRTKCRIALAGVLLLPCCALAQAPAAEAPLNQRVLVVYNANNADSRAVAYGYAAKRGIPQANICSIRPPAMLKDPPLILPPGQAQPPAAPEDSTNIVPLDQFEALVEKPIRKCLDAVGRRNILYIVLSFKMPYKLRFVPETPGKAAIDSYLSDIWDELGTAAAHELNPYFAPAQNRAEIYPRFVPFAAYRSQPGAKTIYAVWRLDAATRALAEGLVDKALEAEKNGLAGQVCVDRRMGDDMEKIRDGGYGSGEWDLHRTADFARKAGFTVLEDAHDAEFGTAPAPLRCDAAIFYAGWYSLDHYNNAFSWNTGAIGIHLDSNSVVDPRGGSSWCPNAVKHGITATSGAVAEPYLEGLPHPGGILRNLLEGANVGDALLRNTGWLKWQILNMGDPLYRPFPSGRPPFRGEQTKGGEKSEK